MTKVSYIHGFDFNGTQKKPPRVADQTEASQRAAGVPKQPFHNYGILTDGEFSLVLLMDQLEVLEGAYPEMSTITRKGRDMIKDALYNGIHSGKIINTGFIPTELNIVAQTIGEAKSRRMPAGSILTGPRNTIKAGIDPFISRDSAINGNDTIPVPDCQMLLNNYNQLLAAQSSSGGSPWDNSNYGQGATVQQQAAAALAEYNTCVKQLNMIKDLNMYLEKSSHHLLYEYIVNPSGESGVVGAKYVLHKNAVSAFSSVTTLSRSNLRLWLRNGIMHNNAENGISPFTPEELIAGFKSNQGNIGNPAVVIAVITLVIAIIKAAAPIILTLVNKVDKENQIKTAAQGIGQTTFGPESNDWYQTGNTNSGGSGSNNNNNNGAGAEDELIPGIDNTTLMIGGAAAAAGILLLSK